MGIGRLFKKCIGESKGWEKAAKLNCVVLIIASLILASLSIAVVANKELDIIFILDGDCDGNMVFVANLALHLLINICSTLVVLNAPSREEINNSHFKGSWLGIGVPSVRNIFLLSRFKAWSWVALLISSIPIHLLFNSIIFEINYRGGQYGLTIATEQFVHNGTYFLPGASLLVPGQEFGGLDLYLSSYTVPVGELPNYYHEKPAYEGGHNVPESRALKNILKAAEYASSWERVEPQECWKNYIKCDDLKYLDLVIVVDKPMGWLRNDMWQLSTNQSRYWDRYVPADEPNHLFFHGLCGLEDYGFGRCLNTCETLLSSRLYAPVRRVLQDGRYYIDGAPSFFVSTAQFLDGTQYSFVDPTILSIIGGTAPSLLGWWNISDTLVEELSDHNDRPPGLQPDAFLLSIGYCLVETPKRICHVALSPPLLLSVTATVVSKTIIAIVVTVILADQKQPPLVTLGDAVASFIEKPDKTTIGFCTFDQDNIMKALRSSTIVLPGPHHWHTTRKWRLEVVPWPVWLSSYLLFFISLSLPVGFLIHSLEYDFSLSTFLPSPRNPIVFIGSPVPFTQAVLLANSPQLLLSFCYLAYNNLFTRMQMAKEWTLLTSTYRPLRVTHPQGNQFATYRLQLPLKYSIPLIIISISLHWLLSNTLYTYVAIGGYYQSNQVIDPSLPQDAAVLINYSPLALVSLVISSVTLIFVPILLGLNSLPKNSINSGCNSFAISAACHSQGIIFNPRNGEDRGTAERENIYEIPTTSPVITDGTRGSVDLEASASDISTDPGALEQSLGEFSNGQRKRSLKKLAQSKIRWGVIKMPPELCIEHAGGVSVEHLGFGAEEDMVSSPVSGNFYI